MTELAIALLTIGIAFCVYQFFFFTAFVAMLASGKYTKVKVGITPGFIGVVLIIIAVIM